VVARVDWRILARQTRSLSIAHGAGAAGELVVAWRFPTPPRK
jgi:hypothetical protein